MNQIFWTGICNEDRIPGISRIEECIGKYGFITDFKFFSDISVSMLIEIDGKKIEVLYEKLLQIISISKNSELIPDYETEFLILFNITFTKGTGNLKAEISSVPG
jgi:hypothetical protein